MVAESLVFHGSLIFGRKGDNLSAANPFLTIMIERCTYYLNVHVKL